MRIKSVCTAIASLGVLALSASPAHAGYVCKGAKAGTLTDVSGYMQQQTATSYVLPQPDGTYLIQVTGYSEGEEVDSYLRINEATRVKLQRCSVSSQELSFRVKCLAKGEPEVITVVC